MFCVRERLHVYVLICIQIDTGYKYLGTWFTEIHCLLTLTNYGACL